MPALEKWLRYLKLHQGQSLGVRLQLTASSKIEKFWRVGLLHQRCQIGDGEFRRKVQSGDVLLFQTKNFTSKMQRTFTGSMYDHVALLLRFEDGQILLCEATGSLGVNLCRWDFFVQKQWHLLYSK